MSPPQPFRDLDLLSIAGEWRSGSGGERLPVLNPWTEETLFEIPAASVGDVEAAYEGAVRAQPGWAEALPSERSVIMATAASLLDARREEIAGWLVREAGSAPMKAQLEVDLARAALTEASFAPYRVEGRILPGDVPGKECRVYRKPVGVVAVISPWNFPLQLSMRSVAPALAVGNAVVLKPSGDTPATGGLLIARLLEEAGLPPGLLSVLVGRSSEIGDPLVQHPAPRVVSFTGSTEVGRSIAAKAAQAPILKRTELELGGNGAFVVLEDAPLEPAVEAAIFGKFMHQGQICMAINRVIVADALHDAFADRFAARAAELKVGDPDDPQTVIGPIINRKQFDSVVGKLEDARRAGAKVLQGGEPEGLVVPPHVLADVTNEMSIAQEEIFGPLAPIIRAQDEAEAVRLANDVEAGLSAAVWTSDLERGARVARRLESGMVHVCDQPVNDLPNNPFGGEKNSGIGRFNGDWAVEAFTTDQWVTLQHRRRRYPTESD